MGRLVSGRFVIDGIESAPVPSEAREPLSDVTRAFGERVRTRRLEHGMTQEELADAAGLHWTYIGQIERGRRNLTLHNIVKLARALGVDAGQLVEGLTPAAVEARSPDP